MLARAKEGHRRPLAQAVLTALLTTMAPTAGAQDEENRVVDQLEQQLLREERERIPFKEETLPPVELIPQGAGQEASYRGHFAVEGLPMQLEALKRINRDMGALQTDIDQLGAKVANLQQVFIEQASLDSVVSINVVTSPQEPSVLQSLMVKMDGQIIYDMKADAGLWLPSKVIELYQGPLDPGEHRLDVVARAAMKNPGKIPLAEDVYRFLNQSFTLLVPSGKFRKKWSVEVKTPAGEVGKITAALVEGQAKL